ncbi:ferrous iron transport protein A [bacterium]|nr:ferrous iron transport protein A [bacterium]RQV94377.1 MAG: ferrous iron transport protein A [bacterium]
MIQPLTLDQIKKDKEVVVVEINGGWGVRQRLNQMGIHPNDRIQIKRSGAMGGPILIQIHGIEVAIGRGMAKKIVVK